MCGITALSRAPHSSIGDGRRFIVAALVAIEPRGYDSTGVAWTRGKAEKVWFHKLVGPASAVAPHLELQGRPRIHQAIGHTRWSSKGAHTYDNAHPVVADNIVLVHNGVLLNDDELVKLAALPRTGEVDSWALAGIIHNHAAIGAEHPADVLDLIDGDAAVAWLDGHEPDVMHLARVVGRPMTVGWTKRGDFVMSSTRETLQQTARLTGVAIGDVIDVPTYTYLKVYQGKVVEWRPIGHPTPAVKPEVRGYAHGVTDLFDAAEFEVTSNKRGARRRAWEAEQASRPDSWWDEAAEQLGEQWADDNWPTGVEVLAARPKNQFDW